MAIKEDSETAGVQLRMPKSVTPYLVGALIAGGGVTGFSAYAGAKGADAQTVAEAESDKVRKECDDKLQQIMLRLDARLASIEGNVGDIKVRLHFVEQSYRVYPRGTLGAPAIGNAP
jgi:hypothetical protein